MLNTLGSEQQQTPSPLRLNPSLHPKYFFPFLNGNNIQRDTFRRNFSLGSVCSLQTWEQEHTLHSLLLFRGCLSYRCMVQDLSLFFLFFPQLCLLK